MTGVARTPAGSPEAARGASTTINQSINRISRSRSPSAVRSLDGRAFFFILWILFGLWFDDVIRFAVLKHLEDHER